MAPMDGSAHTRHRRQVARLALAIVATGAVTAAGLSFGGAIDTAAALVLQLVAFGGGVGIGVALGRG